MPKPNLPKKDKKKENTGWDWSGFGTNPEEKKTQKPQTTSSTQSTSSTRNSGWDWSGFGTNPEEKKTQKPQTTSSTQSTSSTRNSGWDWSTLATNQAQEDEQQKRYQQQMQAARDANARLIAQESANRVKDLIGDTMTGSFRGVADMLGGRHDYTEEDLTTQYKRYQRDLDLYGRAAQDARKYQSQDLYNRAQQGLTNRTNAYNDAYGRYASAQQKARDAELQNLKKNNVSAYYGETMSAKELQQKIDETQKKISTIENMGPIWTTGMGGTAEAKAADVQKRYEELQDELVRYKAAKRHRDATDKAEEMRKIAEDITTSANFRTLSEVGRAMVENRNKQARASVNPAEYQPDDPDDNNQFARAMRDEQNALRTAGYVEDLDSSYIPEDVKPVYYALYAQNPQKAKEWAEYWQGVGEDDYWRQIYEQSGEDAGSRLGAFIQGTFANTVAGLQPFGEGGQYAAKLGSTMIGGGAAGLTEKGVFNTGWGAGEIDVPIFGKQSLGNAYQLGSSMLQSAANATIAKMTGGAAELVGGLGTVLLGSSAAASDYQEKLEQGWDESSATWHALFAGAAEWFFEKYSLDKLVNQDIARGFIHNFLVQGGVEASEEVWTTIANRVTDAAVSAFSGHDNSIQSRRRELIEQGYEQGTAEKMAQQEWLTELLNDALGGFLSGGLMSSGQYAMQPVYRAMGAVDEFNRFTQALSSTGEESVSSTKDLTRGSVGREAANLGATLSAEQVEAARRITGQEGTDSSTPADASAQNDNMERGTGNPSPTDQKLSKRQQRKQDSRAGAVYEQAVQTVERKIDQRGVGSVNEIFNETVEQYGENARSIAQEAITRAVSRQLSEAESAADIDRMTNTEGMAPEVQQAIKKAQDYHTYRVAVQTGDQEAGERVMQRHAGNQTHGGALNMEVTVNRDGTEQKASITGLAKDGKGVVLSDGSTVSAEEFASDNYSADADTKDIVGFLLKSNMGPAAELAMRSYISEANAGRAADGYRYVMDAALAFNQGRRGGVTLQQAQGRSSLDKGTVARFYELGQETRKSDTQDQQAEVDELLKKASKGATGRKGSVDMSAVNRKLSEDEQVNLEAATRLAEVLGVDVGVFVSKTDAKGRFIGENGRYQDGKIWIDLNAGRNSTGDIGSGILACMSHELTHFIQDYAPTAYAELKLFVMQELTKAKGSSWVDRQVQSKINRAKGQNLSVTEAEDEVVADACQNILTDSKAIHDYAKRFPTSFAEVLEWLKNWFSKVKKALSSRNMSTEAEVMSQLEDKVRKAFGELWDKGVMEAAAVHEQIGSKSSAAVAEAARDVEAAGASAQMAEEAAVQNSDRDTEYLELAKDPEKNQARLQEMVVRAAREAGYNSPVLYHGTRQFGFTVFDKQKSDDKKSFFVTTSNEIAQTYSGQLYARAIKSRSKPNSELLPHEIVQKLKKIPYCFDAQYLQGNDTEGKKHLSGLLIDRLFRRLDDIGWFYGGDKNAANLFEAMGAFKKSNNEKAIKETAKKLSDIIFSSSLMYANGVESDMSYELMQSLRLFGIEEGMYWYNGDIRTYEDSQEQLMQNARYTGDTGNYALFGKTDNFLEVDGQGERWNHVPKPDEMSNLYNAGRVTTRQIADYAFNHGYNGVIIRDIEDNGGRGIDAKPGDVYVFFESSMLKSADPVTYDDAGNVIPLSERFNTENQDIRYSERDNAKPRSAQAQRDAGYKLSESKFYSLYSAHKLNMTGRGNVQEQIASIMADGFKGDGGFGNNVMPTNISYDVDENGKRIPRGLSAQKYAPKKGEYILLVPKEGVETKGGRYNFTERVKPGYKPAFDYEIVQADYDYQPYYEMYSKAYDAAKEREAGQARYSERDSFAGETPVEAVRDLIAVHNMTEQNLRDVLELGGFPSPSIAIVKAANGHTNYGPISVVFGRDSIDPELDRRNKIYGADAWTPTAPRIDYPVDVKKSAALENKIEEMSQKVAGGIFKSSSAIRGAGIDNETNLKARDIAEKLTSQDAVRAAYLADKGEDIEPIHAPKQFDSLGNEYLQTIVDHFGETRLADIVFRIMENEPLTESEYDELRELRAQKNFDDYPKLLKKRKGEAKVWEISRERAADLRDHQLEDYARHAWEYYSDAGTTKDQVDFYATAAALREKTDTKAVIEWLEPQVKPLLGKPGIYNGKDPYYPSGNRRSFAALHDEYTLENIVRAMKTGQDERGQGIWGASATGLQAVAAPSYNTISQVKADSSRLKKVSQEDYKAIKDALDEKIEKLIDRIVGADGSFYGREVAGSLMIEGATGRKTTAAIMKLFKDKSALKITENMAKDILGLYKEAALLPTEYFEAKPQRALGFDEIKAIIVPSNMDHEIVQGLQDRGVPVMFFEAGNDTQRVEILNSLDSAKFSERDYSYDFSDTDLILDAADLAADPETAESYWNELLKVMDQKDARDARAQLKGIREQGKKIQELEAKLENAMHQMELTDRKLRTQGIGNVTKAVMEEFEVSDAKKRGVAKKVTETITQAYQKALDAMDNGAEAAAATDILYEGAVKAANILLDEGTHTERHFGKWAVGSYSSYIKEDRQLLVDAMVSKVYEDFSVNRYREPMKATAADRLVERTERRMQKKVDEARDRARTVQEENDRLQRDMEFARNEADASKKQVGELAQQLRDLRDQVKEDKQLTGQERSKAKRRIKTLENALKAKRNESQAWKQLADKQARQLEKDAHAQTIQGINSRVDLFRERLARTNEELRANKAERALNDTTRKLNETARKLSSTANQLQKQLEREQRILNGMLKPPAIQKLLKAEREKAVAKAEAHKDEVFRNYKERKNITALKARIRNLTADIRKAAASPTERNFLPAHLAGAMVDLLDVLEQGQVDTPKAGTKAAAKYFSAADAIRALADSYKQIENDPDYTYASEYDQDVYDSIIKLANQFVRQTNDGHKYNITANEMSLQELQQVYDTVREIRENFRNAAKLIGMDSSLSTYDYAGKILAHQREIREAKAGRKGKKLRSMYENIQIDALSPIRAAHMMDGFQNAEFYQLWRQVEAGLGQKNRIIMDSTKRLQSFKTGQNELTYLKALREKSDYGVRDVNGKPVHMTKMQAIQMLMTWQREEANQNLVHMQEGGVIIRDADLISRGRYSDAKKTQQKVKVTPEMIQKISASMTEWDKGYMKAARDVFSSLLEQSNKVLYTLKRKVHKGEAMYIPEKVADGYLAQEVVKGGEFNLGVKEASATKDLKQKSTLPIIIDGLETMMNRHINDMANYIGLAVPIRNFAKVYNTRTSGIGVDATTVNDEITNTWGDKAGEMMMETLRQVQNGRSYEYQTVLSGLEQKIQSAFVKASLVGKISVFIKQAASYAAAGSVLSQKALDRSQQYIFAIVSAPNGKLARSVYNRIDALTPEHFIRRMGMSMEEIAMDKLSNGPIKGKLQTAGAWLEGKGKVGKAVRHTGAMLNPTNWIQRMDVATTGALVIACEKQAGYDGFKRGTPEFEAHVKELYERVIRETQPMYDPLHRPALQKNAGPMARLLFPFRTVPFQNYGQIMDAFGSFQSASKETKKAAAVHFGKTVWANFESALVFAALGMLSYAIMHKPKRYLDDDDELTLESVLKTYGSDVLDVTLGNLLPYGGTEMKDFVERWINGDKWYQLMSVGPADLVNETASSILKLKEASDRFSAGELSGDGLKNQIINTTMQVTKLLGLPVSNVRDIFRGVSAGVDDWKNGQLLWLNDDTVDRSNATNARRLIKAAEAGYAGKVDEVLAEMRKNILADKPGMKEDKVNSKIQTSVGAYLKEQYLAGDLSEQRASDYLVRYGNAEDEDAAYWKIREWDANAAHAGDDDYSFSPYEQLRDLIADNGDISSEMTRLTEHGVKFQSINTDIKKTIKMLYTAGKISDDEAMAMLQKYHQTKDTKTKQYRPDSEDEAWFALDEWADGIDADDDEEYSYQKYRDIYSAIEGGKSLDAAWDELSDHGISDSTLKSQVKGYIKEQFSAGAYSEKTAMEKLKKYSDMDDNEAYWEVEKWKAKAAGEAAGQEVKDTNYRDLYAAIDAGKPADAAVKELTAHGYKEKDIYAQAKEYLVQKFEEKKIEENKLRNQLSQYAKVVKTEDVDEIVTEAKCYRETGHRIGNLKDDYLDGEITGEQVKQWSMKYGGLSSADADKKVRWYDLQKAKPDLEITEGACNSWYDGSSKSRENGHESARAAGMSIEQYLQAKAVLDKAKDANGNGTGEDEVIAALSQMNLTARQKDALYYERYKGTTKYSRKTW